MPSPFRRVSLAQFSSILERVAVNRRIESIHLHHTRHPNHVQFARDASLDAMWKTHTEQNDWPDIAQHLTIDPEGYIWLGRNWDTPPASACGHNGDASAGPLMIEMIGDFDEGADVLEGAQRNTVLGVVARLQQLFDLAPESLIFHSTMAGISCPGNSINYQQMLAELAPHRARLDFADETQKASPFRDDASTATQLVQEALLDLSRKGGDQRIDPDASACAHHPGAAPRMQRVAAGSSVATRAAALTPDQMQALRPHLVNLSMGDFSRSGKWTTTRADVDAIFAEHLAQALLAAKMKGQPLRLMFQAHGGLNDEATGLAIAQKSVAWWKENDIYPIYFAWETGLLETIGQMMRRAVTTGRRDFADWITDPAIEEAARLAQVPAMWSNMKLSAQLASSASAGREGGARYVARMLAEFCKANAGQVELHAVGHSAGSIFHSWFIPAALELGAPAFRSLHLMAPAMRVDLFKEKLAGLLGEGSGVDALTVYTMQEQLEAADNCAGVYRKSLLYLIYHALEQERKTPILGLEECLRGDPALSALFGLDQGPSKGEIIWSQTRSTRGRSASMATSHGAFDDDASTMGSIARRILNRADHESIVEYSAARAPAAATADQEAEVLQPQALQLRAQQKPNAPIQLKDKTQANRRALCVGINDYPTAPLAGCVADVALWEDVLRTAGFEVSSLLDAHATRAAIVGALKRMVVSSQPGDVLVFQYSGHGTQVPDLNGDEAGGDSPGLDEAICPVDFATGALLIDDDIGKIFRLLPDGVNLTCFMDCCHSGTISRFALGADKAARPLGPGARMRYVPATPQLAEAHREFRQTMAPEPPGEGGVAKLREVVFSACLSTEVAWESAGQGEFTVCATGVFGMGTEGLTNAQFADKVSAAFGAAPRQHAKLYGAKEAQARLLLEPIGTAPTVAAKGEIMAEAEAEPAPDLASLTRVLQNLLQLLQQSPLLGADASRAAQTHWSEQPTHPAPQSMQRDENKNR
ncbi:MAG: caspase family protein [Pseudomonadota bacterium]